MMKDCHQSTVPMIEKHISGESEVHKWLFQFINEYKNEFQIIKIWIMSCNVTIFVPGKLPSEQHPLPYFQIVCNTHTKQNHTSNKEKCDIR